MHSKHRHHDLRKMKSELPLQSCKRPYQTLNENPSVEESDSGSLSGIEPPSAGNDPGEGKLTQAKDNPESIGKSPESPCKRQEQMIAPEKVD